MDTDDEAVVVLRQTIRKRTGKGSNNGDGSTKAGTGRCAGKGCSHQTSFVCGACTHATDPTQKQHWARQGMYCMGGPRKLHAQ
eukprot:scaffold40760_cov261-Skeletonema_dohrnii-CCMP3373.AAC.1